MSNEELIRKYQKCDDTEAQKELAYELYMQNRALLADIARKEAGKFNCLFTDEGRDYLSDYSLTVLEDLEMEAASAFFELLALKEYDGSAKVTTYIYPHIQFRLRRWLEKNIGSMALKKDEMQRIRMVQRYYHVEQMTAEEIAEEMGIPLSEVSEALNYGTHTLYVNDLMPEDGEAFTDPYDHVTTEAMSVDVDKVVYRKLCLEYLRPLFDSMPMRDRDIVGQYLGIFGYEKKPTEEIAKDLCMTADGVIKSYNAIVQDMGSKYPNSMFSVWRTVHAAVQRATGR